MNSIHVSHCVTQEEPRLWEGGLGSNLGKCGLGPRRTRALSPAPFSLHTHPCLTVPSPNIQGGKHDEMPGFCLCAYKTQTAQHCQPYGNKHPASLSFFLFRFILITLYVCVVAACMFVEHVHAWCPRRWQTSISVLGIRSFTTSALNH